MEYADLRHRFADALEAGAASQESGDLSGIQIGYEEFDGSLPRGMGPELKKLHIALAFWDGWIDARNHDWLYYEALSSADWPELARAIAGRLRANLEMEDARVLRHFDVSDARPEGRAY